MSIQLEALTSVLAAGRLGPTELRAELRRIGFEEHLLDAEERALLRRARADQALERHAIDDLGRRWKVLALAAAAGAGLIATVGAMWPAVWLAPASSLAFALIGLTHAASRRLRLARAVRALGELHPGHDRPSRA